MLGGMPLPILLLPGRCQSWPPTPSIIPIWTLVQCSSPPSLAILPRAHAGVHGTDLSLSHPATASPMASQGALPYSSPKPGFQHLAYH